MTPEVREERAIACRFDDPDAFHRHGPYIIRRARREDAPAYCRADARFVAQTYAKIMPPQFALDRLGEADGLAPGQAERFAVNLAAERRGDEPRDRTWIALDGDAIVATCTSSAFAQDWEAANEVVPLPGVTHQLNHLYLDRCVHGTGLADALLRLALPDGLPAYLWILDQNPRAWRFYERHGFVGDGRRYSCGPLWYDRPMLRMYRPATPG